MSKYCQISLKPLTSSATEGSNASPLKSFCDGKKATLDLPFYRSDFFEASRTYAAGMSISGAQEKLSLVIESGVFKKTSQNGRYILKPSPEGIPHAAENEHLVMLISKHLGIDTADCALGRFNDGEYAYICKRFDRNKNGKLEQEELLQCMDLAPDRKYDSSYEAAGKALLEATNDNISAASELIKRVILAYLVGNNDLHLKNFSLVRIPGSTHIHYDQLSPNYDFLCCDFYPGLDSNYLAMDLLANDDDAELVNLSEYGFYTGHDFIILTERLGVNKKLVIKFIGLIKTRLKKIFDLISISFLPEDKKAHLKNLIKQRLKALLIIDKIK
ncbi:type II toxin-antitoxin system HipA family toxin [Pelagibaculum spongiae]|uniref:EF-hand domain-containing protein n=1 Tax=Pelagibaculum spongiae TaxID=2080658 RepID=A0A2V1GQZ5_9GAMM|nr:HipA domain-containing protein [Pelagibaculum spongiae]PVZ64492.1 hypothetical protein DC094_19455 [Pelagibaculum spongiae]